MKRIASHRFECAVQALGQAKSVDDSFAGLAVSQLRRLVLRLRRAVLQL